MSTKIKSPQTPLFYVGIDGTEAVDTVVFGHYWAQNFKWTNLLSKLPLSGQRHKDADHPSLPIRRKGQKLDKTLFVDGCIMPEGDDGTGLDAGNWAGPDVKANRPLIEAAIDVVRTSFVTGPHCDTTKKALGLAGDIKADLIYLSSHGLMDGRLLGEATLHKFSSSHYMFDLEVALAAGSRFTAPKWVIIAACSILSESNWNSWRTMMSDPGDPVRGILGYSGTSPAAESAAKLNITFINKLASGMTMLEAWQKTNEAFGNDTRDNWVALCNVGAVGDTLADWNAVNLTPISVNPLVVKGFTNAIPAGKIVTVPVEPYRVRWLNRKPDKPGDDVDAAALKATEVKPGDKVTIAVAPVPAAAPAPAATFAAGTRITLTLFFIQIRFSKEVDLDAMFTVKDQLNIKTLEKKRVHPEFATGNDTWSILIEGTPTVAALTLECKRAIPATQSLTQGILWFHGLLTSPGVNDVHFDFKGKSVTAR
jgi:hypothetical protein